MRVSNSELLQVLPPFHNSSLLIEGNQDVKDIIHEVLAAHEYFAGDYDLIYDYFTRDTVEQTSRALFDYLKKNIRYVIESEDSQTTKSPSALIAMGHGDCKHYAGFIAGVLDAINRNTGRKINWKYRFSSYSYFDTDPGHVFVVVNDNGKELWIDPVLSNFNDRLQPTSYVDKKVSSMPLYRVSGMGNLELESEQPPVYFSEQPPVYFDEIPEVEIIADYSYNMDEEDRGLSPELLNAIELLLYYDIMDTEGNVNDDLLLSLSTGIPNEEYKRLVDARQLLNTASVSGLFSSIWRGVKKVTLSIPRGAYLSLVALNVFGTASKLKEATTTQSDIDKVRGVWYKLGGDWQALENAIRNGSKKKRIFGIGAAAAALPAWVATASAIIAAMTPIIMAVLKQRQQAGVLDPGFDPTLLDPNYQLPGSGGSIMDFIKNNAVWLGLGAIGVIYLIKKKRN